MYRESTGRLRHSVGLTIGSMLALCTAYILLMRSAQVGDGIRNGLAVCTNIVIPSLFPFMALSGFLSLSPVSDILAAPIAPVTKHLFRLPKETGAVILMSFIGGYPIGARIIASLLEQGRIDEKTSRRMLCFCVNAGPSFIISAVGVSLYSSVRVGATLLAAHVISSVLIGVALSIGVSTPTTQIQPKRSIPASAALVQGVASSANGLIMVCAFVVLFSGISAFVSSSGCLSALSTFCIKHLPFYSLGVTFYNALFIGLLEVTNGCVAAASLGGETAFVLSAFLLSFGGFSVIFQVAACFVNSRFDFGLFVFSRIVNACLAAAIARPLYLRFCSDISVMAPIGQPIMVASPRSIMLALCIIGMCSIVMLSVAIDGISSQCER